MSVAQQRPPADDDDLVLSALRGYILRPQKPGNQVPIPMETQTPTRCPNANPQEYATGPLPPPPAAPPATPCSVADATLARARRILLPRLPARTHTWRPEKKFSHNKTHHRFRRPRLLPTEIAQPNTSSGMIIGAAAGWRCNREPEDRYSMYS